MYARPTLLLVVHSWGGGAIRYARELAAYVAGHVDVVFAWGVDNRTIHISTSDPETAEWTFDLDDGLDGPVHRLKALHVARADLLCVVGLERNIDELLGRLNVPFDVTHTGYELIALGGEQVGDDGLYIGEPAFLARAAARREAGSLPKYLGNAARRISCSRDSAWRAARLMPGSPVVAARLPEKGDPQNIVPRQVPLQPGEPLRILILGRLARHKGLATIREVVQLADAAGLAIEITSLGEPQVGPHQVPVARCLRVLGSFADEQLEPIVHSLRPHLAWFPFPIPETHSFALSDVMRLGLPIVATGLGAIPERVEGRPATWLVPPEEATPEAFLNWFLWLSESGLSIAPRLMSTAHLPPLAGQFYAHSYLEPLGRRTAVAGSETLADTSRPPAPITDAAQPDPGR